MDSPGPCISQYLTSHFLTFVFNPVMAPACVVFYAFTYLFSLRMSNLESLHLFLFVSWQVLWENTFREYDQALIGNVNLFKCLDDILICWKVKRIQYDVSTLSTFLDK